MAAEAVAASTVVVAAGAVFTAAAAVAAASTVVEATEAAPITARRAAAAMAAVGIAAPTAVAGTTIRCLLAAHIPPDAPAIPIVRPVTGDMRQATAATTQQETTGQA
jgi:hypothetical protein